MATPNVLKVYTLGHTGVVIDLSPLEPTLPTDSLRSAQNANHDPIAEHGGALRKRPGWKQFNPVNVGGPVLGGIPMSVVGTGGAPPPSPLPGAPPGFFQRLFFGKGDNTENNVGGNGFHTTDPTITFCDNPGLVFGALTIDQAPGETQLNIWGPSASGHPYAISNGSLFYGTPGGIPAVSPALPTICKIDNHGFFIRTGIIITRNPKMSGFDVLSTHVISVNAMLTEYQNPDAIYIAVLDRVVGGANAGDYGRVLRMSGITAGSYTIVEVYNSLNTNGVANGVPYALENFLGHPWMGTSSGKIGGSPSFSMLSSDSTQPDGFLVGPTESDVTAKFVDVGCMAAYKGILYIGYVNRGVAAPPAEVHSWNSLGVYDASAAFVSNGTGTPNGFVSMVLFNGKLYASYYDTTTGAQIYSFDGTTWTSVFTGNTSPTAHPLHLAVDNIDSKTMYAFGTRSALTVKSMVLWTTDGVTFTNATAIFPFVNVEYTVPVFFDRLQGKPA